ncbi:MAG: metallophosphoesterase, partial [Pseudomonadota bacterium]
DATVQEMRPRCLVMLGDSFDDLAIVSDLPGDAIDRICRLAAGRRVVWLSGNHDPAPVDLPGEHKDTLSSGACVFRHIASADPGAEVSAHYHPKARFWLRGQSIVRPCFLIDRRRIILPAFGTYTGGLRIDDPVFDRLMEPDAIAVLTGRRAVAIPRARAVV